MNKIDLATFTYGGLSFLSGLFVPSLLSGAAFGASAATSTRLTQHPRGVRQRELLRAHGLRGISRPGWLGDHLPHGHTNTGGDGKRGTFITCFRADDHALVREVNGQHVQRGALRRAHQPQEDPLHATGGSRGLRRHGPHRREGHVPRRQVRPSGGVRVGLLPLEQGKVERAYLRAMLRQGSTSVKIYTVASNNLEREQERGFLSG